MSHSRWKPPTAAEEAADESEIGDGRGMAAIVIRVHPAFRRRLNELASSRHVSTNTMIRELLLREFLDGEAADRSPTTNR